MNIRSLKWGILIASVCMQLQLFAERFPEPSYEEIERASEEIMELGKEEVQALPLKVLSQFLWDRYVRGPSDDFHYYDCNPELLSAEQANRPATILVHSSQGNQGQWLPLIHTIQEYGAETDRCGPIFSFNFQDETVLEELIQKIESVRELYLFSGASHVELNLVGYSLGAICSAEYAFDPELWVEDTTVKKVVSIAGRLKNIEPPTDTPFYPYCYDVLERIDRIWEKFELNRGIVELYSLAAENDWLIPQESVLVGDDEEHRAIVPNKGHALVAQSHAACDWIIQWLF